MRRNVAPSPGGVEACNGVADEKAERPGRAHLVVGLHLRIAATGYRGEVRFGPGAIVKAGNVAVRGVAYNDGKARLESVLASFNKGQSWQAAEFQTPDSPYAWYQWKTQANLKPGPYEIWARTIDSLGRTQPLDGAIYWNPNGYEWTGVFKTEVIVD